MSEQHTWCLFTFEEHGTYLTHTFSTAAPSLSPLSTDLFKHEAPAAPYVNASILSMLVIDENNHSSLELVYIAEAMASIDCVLRESTCQTRSLPVGDVNRLRALQRHVGQRSSSSFLFLFLLNTKIEEVNWEYHLYALLSEQQRK